MESIIRDLYDGNISFGEGQYGPDSLYAQAAEERKYSREKLLDSLNDREKALFKNYLEAQGDIQDIVRYNAYTDALKIGIRLMAAVFASDGGEGR